MMNVSIVTYNTPLDELSRCLDVLSHPIVNRVFVVDNSESSSIHDICRAYDFARYMPNKNTGYGSAHNIAIRESMAEGADYHLVLNSDVIFSADILKELVAFMDSNEDVAQVQPDILNADGTRQYTCRLLPRPYDVFARRFLPSCFSKHSDERYLLKFFDHSRIADVPYQQGSFMLFRTKCFSEVGLFDERFFMYPEDIDITRRMHSRFRTVFYPNVSVVHAHRAASYHSLRMTLVHAVNMARYFNKWGWFFDSERRKVNRKTLDALGYKG